MTKAILLSFAALSLCAPIWAVDTTPLDVKPGEWESTVTTETAGQLPIPQEMLDKLSPEQRARMEQALKARAAKGGIAHTNKSCMKKDDLNKPFNPEERRSCKMTVIASSRTKQEIQMACEEGGGKQSGVLRLEATDSEHVKGTMQMTVSAGARTMTANSSFSAKWLGAACTEPGK